LQTVGTRRRIMRGLGHVFNGGFGSMNFMALAAASIEPPENCRRALLSQRHAARFSLNLRQLNQRGES
jgi:hypothetical protein